jgi:hypothetical protein
MLFLLSKCIEDLFAQELHTGNGYVIALNPALKIGLIREIFIGP